MAMPTKVRNWIFTANSASSLNQSLALTGTNAEISGKLLYYFKRTLVGFASGPWTVIQSRDGLGNYGNSDYWVSEAAVSTYSPTLPWIVLQNTFAGVTTQILLIISDSNCYGRAWITTSNLFPTSVGGAAPVVPSSAIIWNGDPYNNTMFWFESNGAATYRLNVYQSWDATGQGVESLRAFCYKGGTPVMWGFLDKLTNIPTGGVLSWAYPIVAHWQGRGNVYPPVWDKISLIAEYNIKAIYGTTRFTCVATAESNDGTNIVFFNSGAVNSLANAYTLAPIGIACFTEGNDSSSYLTPPLMGKLGNVVDWWLGSQALSSGTTYPADSGAPELVQFGHFVWPWDPTAGAPALT